MRDDDQWLPDRLKDESIRRLAKHALRLRGFTLLCIMGAVIATVVALPQLALPPAVFVLYAGGLAFLCSIFARPFPAMFRQWRELGVSARNIGIVRLHYVTIVVEVLLVAVPAIGALLVLAMALGFLG